MNSGESGCTREYLMVTRSLLSLVPSCASEVTIWVNWDRSSTILSSMAKRRSCMPTCISYGRRANWKSNPSKIASTSSLSGLSIEGSDLYIDACKRVTVKLNSKDFWRKLASFGAIYISLILQGRLLHIRPRRCHRHHRTYHHPPLSSRQTSSAAGYLWCRQIAPHLHTQHLPPQD